VMTVFFQMLVTSISRPEQRGVAMSLAGLGFSFSHLTTPVIVGWLADVYSIQVAFMVFGAIGLVWTAGLPLLHRRAQLH
jgi:MFS family permease